MSSDGRRGKSNEKVNSCRRPPHTDLPGCCCCCCCALASLVHSRPGSAQLEAKEATRLGPPTCPLCRAGVARLGSARRALPCAEDPDPGPALLGSASLSPLPRGQLSLGRPGGGDWPPPRTTWPVWGWGERESLSCTISRRQGRQTHAGAPASCLPAFLPPTSEQQPQRGLSQQLSTAPPPTHRQSSRRNSTAFHIAVHLRTFRRKEPAEGHLRASQGRLHRATALSPLPASAGSPNIPSHKEGIMVTQPRLLSLQTHTRRGNIILCGTLLLTEEALFC